MFSFSKSPLLLISYPKSEPLIFRPDENDTKDQLIYKKVIQNESLSLFNKKSQIGFKKEVNDFYH